jgi:hypothetical protein
MKQSGWPRRGLAWALAVAAATLAPATAALGQSPPAPTAAPTPAPVPAAPGGPTPAPSHGPVDTMLSNETTVTTWATAISAQPVRQQPSRGSRVVTRLRFVTSDGFLQSYIALRERRTARGDWVELRLPMRPNGHTGWVRRDALETFSVVHTQLVLNREQHRITLYRDGNMVLTAPVGVGKASTPTPTGHFWITEKFAVRGVPVYGPYAFGTSDYSVLTDWAGGGIIGLHGTNEPQLVPGNPSHGCIRLHNSDILRLARLVPIGTPLLIT